ncbi:MAG: membrane protease YdiL (CAAX protease family) [Planctomycetota bacterium]|jgi:membrane protease YdiL (CAAX protease family)
MRIILVLLGVLDASLNSQNISGSDLITPEKISEKILRGPFCVYICCCVAGVLLMYWCTPVGKPAPIWVGVTAMVLFPVAWMLYERSLCSLYFGTRISEYELGWATLYRSPKTYMYVIGVVAIIALLAYLWDKNPGFLPFLEEIPSFRPGDKSFQFTPIAVVGYMIFSWLQEMAFRRIPVYLAGDTWWCMLSSSILFGITHYWYGSSLMLFSGMLGVVYYYLYIQTGRSLTSVWLVHSLNGLTLFYVDFI